MKKIKREREKKERMEEIIGKNSSTCVSEKPEPNQKQDNRPITNNSNVVDPESNN